MTSSAASAPVGRSSLTTIATISPTKRTTSFATTGRPMSCGKPNGGGPNAGRSMSSASKTLTPGSSSAALLSMPLIFAWASSERTKVTVAVPSGKRFSTYRP